MRQTEFQHGPLKFLAVQLEFQSEASEEDPKELVDESWTLRIYVAQNSGKATNATANAQSLSFHYYESFRRWTENERRRSRSFGGFDNKNPDPDLPILKATQ